MQISLISYLHSHTEEEQGRTQTSEALPSLRLRSRFPHEMDEVFVRLAFMGHSFLESMASRCGLEGDGLSWTSPLRVGRIQKLPK